MLDSIKVKEFWDKRAETYQSLAFESIANLEQDPENLQLKIRDETEKVFGWLPTLESKTILDLGAGVGQWTFRFSDRLAKHITAVEFSETLAHIGKAEALKRECNNVEFVISPAEKFSPSRTYDVVFISGLFVYLNDDQAEALVGNIPSLCHKGTIVLVRDGTAVAARHEINNRYSEHLQAEYSATYRTREHYLALFEKVGFSCIKDENMFPEGHVLNKYPETRLRLFLFESA